MVGHITTSINTIMNRLTAQHHVGPPPEAPRGASKAVLGSVADTLFVSKNRSQHGTLVLIQKTPRIWTSEVRFQNSLPADPPPKNLQGVGGFAAVRGYSLDPPLRSQELGEESVFLADQAPNCVRNRLFKGENRMKPLVGVVS